ncbi:MAG: hypothetical protein PHC28_09410 [Flavobacterium sp.]|uniref:hypothetical protein n=1 Tax=Flavobacterium sp. TaxID=239 RepID=UPI00262C4C46|nr:hypothetical protein [Flavobacterium sp.]MDD5150687.1 hypothetical protein [Flavobacterium sp.]
MNKTLFIKSIRTEFDYDFRIAKYFSDFIEDMLYHNGLVIRKQTMTGELFLSGNTILENAIINWMRNNNMDYCSEFISRYFCNIDYV